MFLGFATRGCSWRARIYSDKSQNTKRKTEFRERKFRLRETISQQIFSANLFVPNGKYRDAPRHAAAHTN